MRTRPGDLAARGGPLERGLLEIGSGRGVKVRLQQRESANEKGRES